MLKIRDDGSLEGIVWVKASGSRPASLRICTANLNTCISLAAPNDFWEQFRKAVGWLAQAVGEPVPAPEDISDYGQAFLRRYQLRAKPVAYYIVEKL